MTKETEYTFEEALEKLEEIVDELEKGDVPLEKAMKYYEEGMKLSKKCHDLLANVQEQMVQLMNEHGELEPFEMQEED